MGHLKGPDPIARVTWSALVVALLSLVATVAVATVPSLRFTYFGHGAHVALEAAAALIAVLVAVLMAARLRQTLTLRDALLTFGLGVLAATNLWLTLLPHVIETDRTGVWTWAPLFAAPVGMGVLALAALAPQDRSIELGRTRVILWTGPLMVTGGVVAILSFVRLEVPSGLVDESFTPRLDGPPALIATQLVAALLCTLAAVGFGRRSRAERDELLGWLAIAMVLGAFARFGYSLFPPLVDDSVHTGDVFRLGSYGAILVGSLREIAGYQPRLVRAAVMEDRGRMARDLHDGMAQELAFILGLVKTRAEEDGWDADLLAVHDAAERALRDSRQAIHALADAGDAPLGLVLGDTARLLAARSGLRLKLTVPDDLSAPRDVGEALLRITREAISNASRHGRATRLDLRVWTDGDVHLRIRDDGRGFRPEGQTGGMGLANMRLRAEALGGSFVVRSREHEGTELYVSLPQISR